MPFDLSTAKPVAATGGFDLSTATPVADSTAPAEQRMVNRAMVIPPAVHSWLTQTLGLPVDTVQNIAQIGKALVALPYLATGHGADAPLWVNSKDDRSNVVGSAQWLAKKSNEAGIPTANPNPNDFASRAIYTAAQAAPNAFLGGAQTAGQLGRSAAMNVASSEAASGAQRAFPNQPVAPYLAGMLTQVAPTLLVAGGKRLLRGPEGGAGQQRVAQNIQDFQESGAGTPTVGQATERQLPQAVESLVAKVPGGYGVMRDKANAEAAGIGAQVANIASGLSSRGTAEQAGRAIERGVTGEGGFVEQFKQKQADLYDKLDTHIPADEFIPTDATKAALARLNAPIPGAPNTSKFFQNAKLQGIEGALKADTEGPAALLQRPDIPDSFKAMFSALPAEGKAYWTQMVADGKLPYQALKQLRTLVGNEVSNWSITNDVPKSKWTSLYGALTEDLKGAAMAAGPEAMQAWNRANTYTRAGMERLNAVNSILDRNGGPEAVFNAAMSGSKTGATTLRAVLQSVPPDAAKSIVATVLNRMGRANPANQNDVGDVFSTERFLTNLNSLSPEAKSALFGRFGSQSDISAISKVADNLRSGSKVLANPSGSGPYIATAGMAGAAGSALLHGNVPGVAAALSPVPASYGAARFMTSPGVVNSLAQDTPLSSYRRFNALLQQSTLQNSLNQ